MNEIKNRILRSIAHNATCKAADLTDQFIHASEHEKEMIHAGIEFEKWLANACYELS